MSLKGWDQKALPLFTMSQWSWGQAGNVTQQHGSFTQPQSCKVGWRDTCCWRLLVLFLPLQLWGRERKWTAFGSAHILTPLVRAVRQKERCELPNNVWLGFGGKREQEVFKSTSPHRWGEGGNPNNVQQYTSTCPASQLWGGGKRKSCWTMFSNWHLLVSPHSWEVKQGGIRPNATALVQCWFCLQGWDLNWSQIEAVTPNLWQTFLM